ncbi:MAG: phosphatase PAP2 family protein [Ethanoligenens sp.]
MINNTQPKHFCKGFIICLIAFGCLSILVQIQMTMGIDGYFQKMFQDTPHHIRKLFTHMDEVFAPANDLYFAFIISAIILSVSVCKHHFAEGLHATSLLAGSTAIAGAANVILKPVFGRIRPDHSSGFSYPSAHAMLAFAFFVPLFYLLSRHILNRTRRYSIITIGLIPALVIGFSRVYLEKHYVTDIAGGFLLSAAIFFGLLFLNQRLVPLHQ